MCTPVIVSVVIHISVVFRIRIRRWAKVFSILVSSLAVLLYLKFDLLNAPEMRQNRSSDSSASLLLHPHLQLNETAPVNKRSLVIAYALECMCRWIFVRMLYIKYHVSHRWLLSFRTLYSTSFETVPHLCGRKQSPACVKVILDPKVNSPLIHV